MANEVAAVKTAPEAPVDTAEQENKFFPSEQAYTVSETEWAELKALLDKRYAEIAALLRYTKTKDESIQRLSAEIQKYRDDFAFSALKPFVNALIVLREDCRKSIRDAKQFQLDEAKLKKYSEYLISDYEEMLSNIGLYRENNVISINGKPLSGLTELQNIPSESLAVGQEDDSVFQEIISSGKINNFSELTEYLKKCDAAIQFALNNRDIIDKTIHDYISRSARTDAEYYFALLAPISRQIYSLYDSLSAKNKQTSDSPIAALYNELLDEVVIEIGGILNEAGVEIETVTGFIDTQKNKILKIIQTNDEKLDRIIAKSYTDCYIYCEKVIYQSKVDVYKFQHEGEKNG
jgi:molecular chaperone GrpE (heat shock protein)